VIEGILEKKGREENETFSSFVRCHVDCFNVVADQVVACPDASQTVTPQVPVTYPGDTDEPSGDVRNG